MELICTNGKCDSGPKLTSPEFCAYLPKQWTDQFAHVNGKQRLFGKNLFSKPNLLWSKVFAFFWVYMDDFEKPCKEYEDKLTLFAKIYEFN